MLDFPNNFDYIIYGTGIVESILSAALSTTGNSVLHIDRNEYYGGYSGCLRLSEMEKLIDKWKNNQDNQTSNDLFTEFDNHVKYVTCNWNLGSEILETTIDENGSANSTERWTKQTLHQRMRCLEFEIFPRILFSESKTIDALIQSDVTRYLEFKFISKFATLSDDNIILIPINRSDIVKTKVFSLRQKRQLTSFLEWCFRVDMDDEVISKYVDRPLFELMRTEKNIDHFTEKIILDCMAMSSPNVETKEGILKIKRLLLSFNKYGPYPIMWPNYGCSEIPQAFCRMSAVFGAVYSLNTTIRSCSYQSSLNGEYNNLTTDAENQVPIDHRKIKLTLSNDCDVYTDKIISHKSYLNSSFLANVDKMRWISRAIYVINKSLINEIRDQNDILMFPFHLNLIEQPAILLEFPTDNIRNTHKEELYIVHLCAFTDDICDSKDLFQAFTDKIFEKYDSLSTESLKPKILFECFFTLPEFSDVSLDITRQDELVNHMIFVNSSSKDIEFDECLKEANSVFLHLSPGVEFLPRPPNPEDIIQLGQETIPSTNQISGDFPFATNFLQLNSEVIDCPGDGVNVPLTVNDNEGESIPGPILSGLISEMELDPSTSYSADY